MAGQQPGNGDNRAEEALTSIREGIHCYTTPECKNEMDRIIVKTFLDTLAEVAVSIASRRKVE